MTEQQLRALDFIREWIADTGFAPTIREIAAKIGVGVSHTHRIVAILTEEGKLRRTSGRHRALELADVPDLRAASTAQLRVELGRRGVTLDALATRDQRTFGAKKTCAADSCGSEVQRGQLFCRPHWFGLSRDLRDGIMLAFSRRDVTRYQELVSEARDIADGWHAGAAAGRAA